MLLQSCVATTTLQKGGGKQKGAEFSKVFQGFCLRLQVYDFASIFARFAPTLIQLLKILMDTKFRGFIEH